MSTALDDAVTQMLSGYAGRVPPERVKAFTDAISDEVLCERCAMRAARILTARSKYAPTPAVFVVETRDEMDGSAHNDHMSDRAMLKSTDAAFWATEAPAIVKKYWRALSGEQAIAVAKMMESYDVPPNKTSICVELGFVDEHGPTTERQWWFEYLRSELPSVNA